MRWVNHRGASGFRWPYRFARWCPPRECTDVPLAGRESIARLSKLHLLLRPLGSVVERAHPLSFLTRYQHMQRS